jgi:carboxyl-terminal processing protease
LFSSVSTQKIYSTQVIDDTLRVQILWFEDGVASRLLDDIKKNAVKHIAIDLRDNPGGKIKEAIEMIDLFVSNGAIVTLKKRSHTQTYLATKASTHKFESVTILVNKNTASSAELVAKALEKYIGATLVGGQTYGKNKIQALIYLDDTKTQCIKLTIGEYQL